MWRLWQEARHWRSRPCDDIRAHTWRITRNLVTEYAIEAGVRHFAWGWQALEAENAALAQQLASVGKGAALAESTMRELATLHQMLSTQARICNTLNLKTLILPQTLP